jgi:hypothetical protein
MLANIRAALEWSFPDHSDSAHQAPIVRNGANGRELAPRNGDAVGSAVAGRDGWGPTTAVPCPSPPRRISNKAEGGDIWFALDETRPRLLRSHLD